MSDLTLTTTPLSPRVLSGESLVVRTMIRNDGAGPAPIPGRFERSPFVYRMVPAAGGPAYTLSALHAATALFDGRVAPPAAADPYLLQPGKRTPRTEDLASLAAEPLAAGEYRLDASFAAPGGRGPRIVSPPAALTVVAPEIALLSSVFCPSVNSMGTVFAHREDSGALVVLQRETLPGTPLYCPFYRRLTFAPEDRLVDLATTVRLTDEWSGRWLAWLREDGTLGAAYGNGDEIALTAPPIATALRSARFVQPGLELAGASPLFFVAGEGPSGPVVQRYAFSPETQAWTRGPECPLGAALPERLVAHHEPGGETWIVWQEPSAQGSVLCARRHGADGSPIDPRPSYLGAITAPLLALELAPLSPEQPGVIQLLLGPNTDGKMLYVEIPLGGAPATTVLDPPEPPAEAWAVCRTFDGAAVIVAASGDSLLLHDAGTRTYQAVAKDIGRVQHLRVATMGTPALWAEWDDPALGLRARRLL